MSARETYSKYVAGNDGNETAQERSESSSSHREPH